LREEDGGRETAWSRKHRQIHRMSPGLDWPSEVNRRAGDLLRIRTREGAFRFFVARFR
jgi:hypothetical protein